MCTAETFVDLYYISNKRRCKEASAKAKKMFVCFFCLFCFVFLMGLFSSNIPLIMMNMVLKCSTNSARCYIKLKCCGKVPGYKSKCLYCCFNINKILLLCCSLTALIT